MKVEHQSHGSFEYDCKKGCDCYFCDVMSRPALGDDESFRKNGWTPNELKYLIEQYPLQTVNETCLGLRKTRGAVFTKVYELRKSMTIGNPLRDMHKFKSQKRIGVKRDFRDIIIY